MGKYKTLKEHGFSESELRESLNNLFGVIEENDKGLDLKSKQAVMHGLFYGFAPTEENMDAFHEAMKKELKNVGRVWNQAYIKYQI